MTSTPAAGNSGASQDGPLPKLSAPNDRFMRYLPSPVWNFLCDHYFRLEIDGWHRIPTSRRC